MSSPWNELLAVAAIVITAIAMYSVGARGTHLLLGTVAGVIPAHYVIGRIIRVSVTLKLSLVRGPWTRSNIHDDNGTERDN